MFEVSRRPGQLAVRLQGQWQGQGQGRSGEEQAVTVPVPAGYGLLRVWCPASPADLRVAYSGE